MVLYSIHFDSISTALRGIVYLNKFKKVWECIGALYGYCYVQQAWDDKSSRGEGARALGHKVVTTREQEVDLLPLFHVGLRVIVWFWLILEKVFELYDVRK